MSTAGSARPLKRQRVDGDSPQPKAEAEEPQSMYHHHPKYWYGDGNLIVISNVNPTTLVRTAFRVFHGVVSKHSAHLAQRLAKINDASIYCGCPVLPLENSSNEIESLLQWTLSKTFDLGLPKQLKLEHVLAFYRLGLEYGIDDMRQEAMARIMACMPATLEGYESAKRERPNLPISYVSAQQVDIALFCGMYGLKAILPVALYACCCYYTNTVEEHGKRAVKGYSKKKTIDGLKMRHWLCRRVLQGKILLIGARIARIQTIQHANADPSCQTSASCRSTLLAIARTLLGHRLDDGSLPTQMLSLDDEYEGDEHPCDSCWTHEVKKWDTARQKTWDDLPKLFGLTDKASPVTS